MYRFKKGKSQKLLNYTDKIRHNLKKEKWQSFSACQIFFSMCRLIVVTCNKQNIFAQARLVSDICPGSL